MAKKPTAARQARGSTKPKKPAPAAAAPTSTAPTAPADVASTDNDRPSAAGMKLVVTGPKGGRWRAGVHFGPEPVALSREEFFPAEGKPDVRSLERLLSIVSDPHLQCVEENAEGEQRPIQAEDVEGLRYALDAARAEISSGD